MGFAFGCQFNQAVTSSTQRPKEIEIEKMNNLSSKQ